MKLKEGDIEVQNRDGLVTVVYKYKRGVYMLTNIHNPLAEGNVCDEKGDTL
jgi:hypothetical protein